MGLNKTDTKVPCYECTKRHNGCHSSCDEYKAYHESRVERSRVINEGRSIDRMVREVRANTLKRVTGKKPKLSAWKG